MAFTTVIIIVGWLTNDLEIEKEVKIYFLICGIFIPLQIIWLYLVYTGCEVEKTEDLKIVKQELGAFCKFYYIEDQEYIELSSDYGTPAEDAVYRKVYYKPSFGVTFPPTYKFVKKE